MEPMEQKMYPMAQSLPEEYYLMVKNFAKTAELVFCRFLTS